MSKTKRSSEVWIVDLALCGLLASVQFVSHVVGAAGTSSEGGGGEETFEGAAGLGTGELVITGIAGISAYRCLRRKKDRSESAVADESPEPGEEIE